MRERLGSGLPPAPKPGERARVLVHGVSVGEVKAAQSLVRALAAARPDLEIVLSATTDTGVEVARRLYPDRRVVRFPFDLAPVVSRFLDRVAPVAVVLVELELWPAFLRALDRRGVPVAIVNGRITERSLARLRRGRGGRPAGTGLLCDHSKPFCCNQFWSTSTSRALLPLNGPTTPSCSNWSISRPARE